jgi:hypothetical protein
MGRVALWFARSSRCGVDWRDLDGKAKILQAADKPEDVLAFSPVVEVIGAQVVVEGSAFEHVIGGGEDRGSDGADGFFGAATGSQAMELGLQVALLCSDGSPGALDESCLQPGRAFAHAGGPALAGALVVPGTEPGPGNEVAFGREPTHVETDLGGNDLGSELADARDRAQDLDRYAKGCDVGFNLVVDRGDGGVDRVNMPKQQS